MPDSFDPRQPDLPSMAVDPDPEVPGDGEDTRHVPEDVTDED